MPLLPFSNRKSTVGYAIDLLRAHQIRRENVFLHEQLKTCLSEIAALRDQVRAVKASDITATIASELKELKASVQASETAHRRGLALADRHEGILNEKIHELVTVQQSCNNLESEILTIKSAATKQQEDAVTKNTYLEAQVKRVQADCRDLSIAQQQHDRHFQVTLESFQTALSEKADSSELEALINRLETESTSRPLADNALPSVSRVSESIQVFDSQHTRNPRGPDTLPVPLEVNDHRHHGGETIPEDLDLDANANTFSYAGHHQIVAKQNDSLVMLSPSTAQATQLVKVKTLRQRKFDGWISYFHQGRKLLQTLPRSFEETVVHNFVEGIFSAGHKKQCKQWLDANGWNWANVSTFGDLCSQVGGHETTNLAPRNLQQLKTPSRMKNGLSGAVARGQTGRSDENTPHKGVDDHRPRRSQRLVEKSIATIPKKTLPASNLTASPSLSPSPQFLDTLVSRGSDFNNIESTGELPKIKQLPPPAMTGGSSILKRSYHARESRDTRPLSPPRLSPNPAQAQISANPSTKKRKAGPSDPKQPGKRLKSSNGETGRHRSVISELVSAQKHLVKPVQESSDDDGFLHRPRPKRHSEEGGREAFPSHRRSNKRHTYGTKPSRKGKRSHRSPLPPPPEIPILPTTDEE